nr:peptide-methionine (S)-S-oxide reductase [Sodalis-like endosymbiont of Proechinophthirus fluctus]
MNDISIQYRSVLFPQDDDAPREPDRLRPGAIANAGDNQPITTAPEPASPFYYAEDEHQQYLHKHPNGYCALVGIGECLPTGTIGGIGGAMTDSAICHATRLP